MNHSPTWNTDSADLTLDISDPFELPYYETNTKIMCRTDNTSKARLPKHRYNARLRGWEQWKANQSHAYPEGSLFREWEDA